MDIFIYNADVYCEGCGAIVRAELDTLGKTPKDLNDETTWDSDEYPKGPYHVGEADYPRRCAQCKVFLENPLTTDGENYVRETVDTGDGDATVLAEWRRFYSYLFRRWGD